LQATSAAMDGPARTSRPRAATLSPSPPPRAVPSFLENSDTMGVDDRRVRFRRVYMEKLVEGFGEDLEKLRAVGLRYLLDEIVLRVQADPTLGPNRLQLLIESLASGEFLQ
jgi:ribosome assembly protein 3